MLALPADSTDVEQVAARRHAPAAGPAQDAVEAAAEAQAAAAARRAALSLAADGAHACGVGARRQDGLPADVSIAIWVS